MQEAATGVQLEIVQSPAEIREEWVLEAWLQSLFFETKK